MSSTAGFNISSTNKYSAVGNGDVIHMQYVLMIGDFDKDPDTLLAYTDSYNDGVSLSSIKWGYVNTSATGENSLGDIEFTLHDIAGIGFANFIRIRRGSVYIHFLQPMSNGDIADPGVFSLYFPIIDNCNIEFNATQGFTYTFSGRPIVQLSKTKQISSSQTFDITGSKEKPTIGFGDFCNSVLRTMWNKHVMNDKVIPDEKKLDTMINEFVFVDDDKLHYEDNTASVTLERVEKIGDFIKPFTVQSGEGISSVLTRLFHTRFKAENQFPNMPQLEANFVKWQGTGHVIQIRFADKKTEDVTADMTICIGDDANCGDAEYRGQLSNIDFGDLISTFSSGKSLTYLASGDSTQSGTVSSTATHPVPLETDSGGAEKQFELDISQNKSLAQNSIAVWGQLSTLLANNKIPGFTIKVELPYSFGFTPKILGGKLKDSIEGGTGVGIHYTQGCNLQFYWYVDPDCQELKLQEMISRDYRITSVTHTIGLNGNTTEVGLSHLHIGN